MTAPERSESDTDTGNHHRSPEDSPKEDPTPQGSRASSDTSSSDTGGAFGQVLGGTPLKFGGLFGVVAFGVGFAVTYLLFRLDGEMIVEDSDEATTFDAVGWLFYNAHFSETEESFEFNGESRTQTFSLISDVSTDFPELVFHVVPVVALLGAGFLLVWIYEVNDVTGALFSGASIVLGYFPLAILVRELLNVTMSDETLGGDITYTVGPDVWTSLLYVGLLYPLLIGGIGGFLAHYLGSR